MPDKILFAQNWLLHVYPGLLPLAGLVFSLLSSWHCILMCGPIIGRTSNRSASRLLAFRLFSYTFAGGVFGFFGEQLRSSLEMKAVGAISFFVFSAVTLFCVLPLVFPRLKKISAVHLLNQFRGLGWSFVPCHLLMFFYGIAILSSSALTGALILFGHAVMTTPALSFANSYLRNLSRMPRNYGLLAKGALLFLIVFNLCYFWGVLMAGELLAKHKLFFCL